MKALNIVLRIALCLILLSPILGILHIFSAPTADMYYTQQAFDFITMLSVNRYVPYLIASIFGISIVLILTGRMALAALLILPITVNIVSFHLFLDGGLFTAGAILADALLLLNAYFLWQNRKQYRGLCDKRALA